MPVLDGGVSSAGKANVDNQFNLTVNSPGYTSGGIARGGGLENAGAATSLSEVDAGLLTGARDVLSGEVDDDYRARIAVDNPMDYEQFNYTVQNTAKHTYTATTMAATMGASGLLTNSGSITTTATGLTFGTHRMFPVVGNQTLICETAAAFSAQPNANSVVDFGLFQRGVTAAFAPLDGFYFRVDSTGVKGVVNSGGVETSTAVFPLALGTGTYVYSNNAVNKYLIQVTNVRTTFWINNLKIGTIANPVGANLPFKSQALPWSIRHAIVGGTAGAAMQALVSDYKVTVRGPSYGTNLAGLGSRVLGAFQALSGATPGSLTGGTVTTGTLVNPTAAVPTNTTAALGTGLGGSFWETASVAVNTDVIIDSYQVPAGSSTVQGRTLRISGLSLSSYIQTVIAGGPFNVVWQLAFGHTSVSLATTETGSMVSATTKAPRRVMLPELGQVVTAAQAVSTNVTQYATTVKFANPIYVNPGEFVALIKKHVGTVGTAGTIAHTVAFDYSWE